jgi:hypothetical protein
MATIGRSGHRLSRRLPLTQPWKPQRHGSRAHGNPLRAARAARAATGPDRCEAPVASCYLVAISNIPARAPPGSYRFFPAREIERGAASPERVASPCPAVKLYTVAGSHQQTHLAGWRELGSATDETQPSQRPGAAADRGCDGHRLEGCAMHRADPKAVAGLEVPLYAPIVADVLLCWEFHQKCVRNFTTLR